MNTNPLNPDQERDPAMTTRTETHRVVDIPTGGGATLRVAHVDGGNEGPHLLIVHGFGGGDEPFRRPGWCAAPIRLPVEVLPELRRALEELERGSC